MTSVVYLIGPSGVGKTTIADYLAESGRVVHVDLDRRLRELDWTRPRIEVAQDWTVLGPALDEIDGMRAVVPILVTLGAGTQDIDRRHGDVRLTTWLSTRRDRVILLEGGADELFGRNAAHQGHRARFDHLEFGRQRLRLYEVAATTVRVVGAGSQKPQNG